MVEKIAIIGSGKIGQSWAVLFSKAGYSVVLHDVESERLDAAVLAIRKILEGLKANALLDVPIEDVLARISSDTSLKNCVSGATYVQECVFEKLELKREVLASIDKHLDGDLCHRDNFLVAHPVNPPLLCPLVELVPAPWTNPTAVEKARDVMKRIGQEPVVIAKEVKGFAVNRLQYAILAECWRLVKDGVMSPEDVDKVVSQGLGMRWAFFGPLQISGINGEGIESHNETYGEGFLRVCQDFGPAPDLRSAEIQAIAREVDKKWDAEKMKRVREYRDSGLMGLAKLKKALGSGD